MGWDLNYIRLSLDYKYQTLPTNVNNRFHKIFSLVRKHRTRLTCIQHNICKHLSSSCHTKHNQLQAFSRKQLYIYMQ